MKYTFDTTLDHRYNGSVRWAQPEGRQDILGMGTADLDYFCAPCIREATAKVCEENTFNYRSRPRENIRRQSSAGFIVNMLCRSRAHGCGIFPAPSRRFA